MVGKVTEGVVVKISNDGLLLQLWGDLRGFAPRSQLSSLPRKHASSQCPAWGYSTGSLLPTGCLSHSHYEAKHHQGNNFA